MQIKRYTNYIRIAVCGLFIYFISRRIDYDSFIGTLRNIRPDYALLSMIVFFLHDYLKTLKWNVLLVANGTKVPTYRLLQLDYASRFLSFFFPSVISLDVFRTYGLSKEFASLNEVASSVILDRIISLFSLILVAATSSVIFYNTVAEPVIPYYSISVLALFTSSTMVFRHKSLKSFIDNRKPSIEKSFLLFKLSQIYESVNNYHLPAKVTCNVMFLSILTHVSRVAIYYCASLALGLHISLKHLMVFTPLVIFLSMLPLSVAGIGIREASFVYFFSKVGVPSTSSFAVSSLVSLMVILFILPGGVILAIKGLAIKRKSASIR